VFYNTKTLYEPITTNVIIPSNSFSMKLHNGIWFLSYVLKHLKTIFCYQNYDLKKIIDLNVHSYVMKEKNHRTSRSY
jgi:phenolic acid decarboxylase